tara:strand:- start:36 stop:1064 length:1029 start_codon:yes stop_codon:yes gene_type:complete
MAQKLFDVRKYQDELPTLVDGSDSLANQRELVISFYHEPSKRSVFFKAFITAFNESYNSNFTPTEAFGRTDPIYQYKNTTRKITLAFKVLAASEGEAFENLGRVSALQQMLYASYTGDPGNALNITQSPLIRLKVMNLLQKNDLPSDDESINDYFQVNAEKETFINYTSTSEANLGLLGIIDNVAVNHNLEGDDGVFYKKGAVNTILPKFIDINLSFSPIHETTLGWQDSKQINSLFPYGAKTTEVVQNGSPANALSAYKEQAEKEKAEEQARRVRQQQLDSAKARYSGVLGDMRMNADVRRSGRGNGKALGRLAAGSMAEVEGAADAFGEGLDGYYEDFIE